MEGCNKDIRVEKDYYQRYRICEEHLKLGSLLKDGIPQRFCQQCGRFHELAEFDGDKRCVPLPLSRRGGFQTDLLDQADCMLQSHTLRSASMQSFHTAGAAERG